MFSSNLRNVCFKLMGIQILLIVVFVGLGWGVVGRRAMWLVKGQNLVLTWRKRLQWCSHLLEAIPTGLTIICLIIRETGSVKREDSFSGHKHMLSTSVDVLTGKPACIIIPQLGNHVGKTQKKNKHHSQFHKITKHRQEASRNIDDRSLLVSRVD